MTFSSGLLLIANSNVIGKTLGDAETTIFAPNQTLLLEYAEIGIPVSSNRLSSYCWTVLLIVIGAILVDFSTDTILNPSRAYLLDVCIDGEMKITILLIFEFYCKVWH